jgi:hypothetical protein
MSDVKNYSPCSLPRLTCQRAIWNKVFCDLFQPTLSKGIVILPQPLIGSCILLCSNMQMSRYTNGGLHAYIQPSP